MAQKGRLVFRHRLFLYCGDNKFRRRRADQHLHPRHLINLAPNLCDTTTTTTKQTATRPCPRNFNLG